MTPEKTVEITREEFERLWGLVPPGDAIGVDMMGKRGGPVVSYRFIGKTHEEIEELEKLFKREVFHG